MSKHLRVSSKATLAIFACLALLCSLFVVSFVALAGSDDGTYTPKRYVTMEVGDSVNPTFRLNLSKSLFDAAETYTIKAVSYTHLDVYKRQVFSLFIAMILRQKFVGRTFCRAVFFFPVIIASGVVITILRTQVMMTGSATSEQMCIRDRDTIT